MAVGGLVPGEQVPVGAEEHRGARGSGGAGRRKGDAVSEVAESRARTARAGARCRDLGFAPRDGRVSRLCASGSFPRPLFRASSGREL